MKAEKEVYAIMVEVRSHEHKRAIDKEGNRIPDIQFDLEVSVDKVAEHLERQIKDIHKILKQINPTLIFNFSALVYNGISDTWMEMYGYYGNEDRFLKFT